MRVSDEEMREHIEVLGEDSEPSMLDLRDTRAALRALLNAYDDCDSNRGAFSCCEQHDCRCPQARGIGACECGRDELDAALAACRKAVEP